MRRMVTYGIVGGLTMAYARYIETSWLQTKRLKLKLPRLGANFASYKIAQISDLHFDDWLTYDKLMRAVTRINRAEPDLIVITGDFVSHGVRYSAENLSRALGQLQAPDGVLAIPGNHDYASRVTIRKVRQLMADCSIRDLSNTHHSIRRGEDQLHIAGVDSVTTRQARLDLVLDALPGDGCVILLAHEPDYADIAAATGRFDLQLSGHTHGGQVRLPLYGALYGPKHGHSYKMGLYDVGDDMQLYVNRGLGTVMLPLRFNCRPEITLLTLQPGR